MIEHISQKSHRSLEEILLPVPMIRSKIVVAFSRALAIYSIVLLVYCSIFVHCNLI